MISSRGIYYTALSSLPSLHQSVSRHNETQILMKGRYLSLFEEKETLRHEPTVYGGGKVERHFPQFCHYPVISELSMLLPLVLFMDMRT